MAGALRNISRLTSWFRPGEEEATAVDDLFYVLSPQPALEEDIRRMEETIAKLPSMTHILQSGGPEDIIRAVFSTVFYHILDSRHVDYKCYCSEERTRKILISLGKNEVRDMLAEKEEAEVKCHFCDAEYRVDLNDIMNDLEHEAPPTPLDKP